MDDHHHTTPRSAFGRGWIPGGRVVGLPDDDLTTALPSSRALLAQPDGGAPLSAAPHNAFTPERRAHFLALLAERGNVRQAAVLVGISAQAAYLARRRDRLFAAGWEAALVEARHQVEQVLADRALDGVEEPVYYHGELIALRRRFDNRLLLAHLARLDARTARSPAAQAHAERFDEIIALVAGAAPPAGMAPAAEKREADLHGADLHLPPTRAAHIARATAGLGPGAYARARTRAAAEWDGWAAAARDRVDDLAAAARGPTEFKSLHPPAGMGAGEAGLFSSEQCQLCQPPDPSPPDQMHMPRALASAASARHHAANKHTAHGNRQHGKQAGIGNGVEPRDRQGDSAGAGRLRL